MFGNGGILGENRPIWRRQIRQAIQDKSGRAKQFGPQLGTYMYLDPRDELYSVIDNKDVLETWVCSVI